MGELETDPGVTNGSQGVLPPLKYQVAGNGSGDPGPGDPTNRKRRETGEGTIFIFGCMLENAYCLDRCSLWYLL